MMLRWSLCALVLLHAATAAGAEPQPAEAEPREPAASSAARAAAVGPSLAPTAAHTLSAIATVGSAWTPRGPGPILEGSNIENVVPDNEAVGAVQVVTPHPMDPQTLYVGAVNGGIWRTQDAQAARPTWQPLTDAADSLSIGALEFDPADSNTLLAGVGRFSNFGQRGAGLTGLLISTDAGTTWTSITDPLLVGENVAAVGIRGYLMLAAANGFFGSGGLFRSDDGGVSFALVSGMSGSGLPSGAIFDLAGDPTDPMVFYASVEDTGIYRSSDGGATWTNVSSGDPTLDGVITTSSNDNTQLSVASNGRLYAGVTLNEALAYVGFTDDEGTTWTAMDLPQTMESDGSIAGIHPGTMGDVNFSLAADAADPSRVHVGGDRQPRGLAFPNFLGANQFSGRLFRGDTTVPPAGTVPSPQWEHLTHRDDIAAIPGGGTANSSAPHPDSRSMAFDAGGDLIQSDDGGVYARTSPGDNTGDWLSINGDIQVAELHDVAYDSVSQVLIAGSQDNASPQQSSFGDPAWDRIGAGDGGDVAVDETSVPGMSIRYSSNQNLRSFRRRTYDSANNLISEVFPIPLTVSGGGAALVGQFKTPIELNAVDPLRLVIGANNSVYESLDQGDNITEIGVGIRANRPDALAYGGRSGGIDNPNVLWVGSGSQVLLRTTAAGALAATAYSGGTARDIVLDPQNWQAAFVNDSDQVFATFDAGATWSDISDNLGVDLGPTLVEDFRAIEYIPGPFGNDAIAVGGRRGVFVRLVNQASGWVRFGSGLPGALAFDLDYDATDDVLAVATLGRSAWTLSGAAAALNRPPIADAGADTTVECSTPAATPVMLDGTGSSDPDGDPLSFSWTGPFPEGGGTVGGAAPTVTLALGSSVIDLVVDDGRGGMDSDSVQVLVAVREEGLEPPLAGLVPEGDAAPLPARAFRRGSVLPLRLRLFCGATGLTASDVDPPEIVGLVRTGTAIDVSTIDLDAGQSNDDGSAFRSSAGGAWAYNLSTRELATGTYVITLELPDGRRVDAAFVLR